MILGASALGQFALAGTGYEAAITANYVDLSASVALTSSITSALQIIGTVPGEVHLSAVISMSLAMAASLTAAITFPNPGVSFTMSDKAGGA